jgi:hypothetical protein
VAAEILARVAGPARRPAIGEVQQHERQDVPVEVGDELPYGLIGHRPGAHQFARPQVVAHQPGHEIRGLLAETQFRDAHPHHFGAGRAVAWETQAAIDQRCRRRLGDVVDEAGEPQKRNQRKAVDFAVERFIEIEPVDRGAKLAPVLAVSGGGITGGDGGEVVLQDVVVVQLGLLEAAARFEFGDEPSQAAGSVEGAQGGAVVAFAQGSQQIGWGRHDGECSRANENGHGTFRGRLSAVAARRQARGCALSYSRRFWSSVRCV